MGMLYKNRLQSTTFFVVAMPVNTCDRENLNFVPPHCEPHWYLVLPTILTHILNVTHWTSLCNRTSYSVNEQYSGYTVKPHLYDCTAAYNANAQCHPECFNLDQLVTKQAAATANSNRMSKFFLLRIWLFL